MEVALRKVGNSQAVIIPKAVLLQLGLEDRLDMKVENNQIVLSAPKLPRAGWAAAAKEIAKQNDDLCLDFPEECEDEWVW